MEVMTTTIPAAAQVGKCQVAVEVKLRHLVYSKQPLVILHITKRFSFMYEMLSYYNIVQYCRWEICKVNLDRQRILH